MNSFWIQIIFGHLLLISSYDCSADQKVTQTSRALEYPAQWRPVAVTAPEHLISIAGFESSNKAQIAQIAHHNAQILRQIKGLHPPITQYHNPFPLYHTGTGNAGKHYLVQANNVYQTHPSASQQQQQQQAADISQTNLLTSSSNVAQTVLPHMSIKHNYLTNKLPSFVDKSVEPPKFKFLNSIHTSTAKIPGLIKTGSLQPNFSPVYLTTTSRMPIIRDVTFTPPPTYRSTQKPLPVVEKPQVSIASPTRLNPAISAQNHIESISMPGRIITAFSQFLPQHLFRDPKPRLTGSFMNIPYGQSYANSYTGPIIHNGPYLTKPNYVNSLPPSAISSSYNYQHQHYVAPVAGQQNPLKQNQHLHSQQYAPQHQQTQYQQTQQQQQQQQQQTQQHQQIQHQQTQQHQQAQQHQQTQQHQQAQLHQQAQQQQHQQTQQQQLAQQHQQEQQQQNQKAQQHQQMQQNQFNTLQNIHQPQQFPQTYQHVQHYQQPQQHQQSNHQQYQPNNQQEETQSYHQQTIHFEPNKQQHQNYDPEEQLRQLYRQQQNQDESLLNFSSSRTNSEPRDNNLLNSILSPERTTQNPGSYLPPLPSVPPSVLSPFFQQIQQQQQKSTTSTTTTSEPYHFGQKDTQEFYLHSLMKTQDGDFRAVKDEFSRNLVPPPPHKHKDSSQLRDKPALSASIATLEDEHKKALDILNKYNIPAISPLQDANRFDYSKRSQTTTTTTTTEPSIFNDIGKSNLHSAAFTTEKPNVFKNLNRQPESEYKQHKVMHPGYTGARRPSDVTSTRDPFFPTPMSYDHAITHSFFTIEDAVTLSPRLTGNRPLFPTNNIYEVEDILRKPQQEQITEVVNGKQTRYNSHTTERPTIARQTTTSTTSTTSTTTTTTPAPTTPFEPSSSTKLRGRNKMRRRRPRPTSSTTDGDIIEGKRRPQTDNEIVDQYNGDFNRYPNHKENDDSQKIRQGYRNRNRGRPSNETADNSVEKPTSVSRRPIDATPNRKTEREDTKFNYPTSAADSDVEQTTINLNDNLFLTQFKIREKPRKSVTTMTPVETLNPWIITSSPIQPRQPTEAIPSPSISFRPTLFSEYGIGGTEAHPEDNTVIISTKAVFNEAEVPGDILQNEIFKTGYFDQRATLPVSIETSSESYPVDVIQQTKIEEDVTQRPSLPTVEQRQRTRFKDRSPDVFMSSTESSIIFAPKLSTAPSLSSEEVFENEIEELITPQAEITRDNRLNVRFPMITSTSKPSTDAPYIFSMTPSTTTKPTRSSGIKKFDAKNRPRFSVKDYRLRTNATSTTEMPPTSSSSRSRDTLATAQKKLRFPTRTRLLPELRSRSTEKSTTSTSTSSSSEEQSSSTTENPVKSNEVIESSSSSSTETTRRRFSPKDRYSSRIKQSTTTEPSDLPSSPRAPSTRRGSTRRMFSSSSTTNIPDIIPSRAPIIRNTSHPLRRPQTVSLRQRIQNHHKTTREPVVSLENLEPEVDERTEDSQITESYRHETAIMKIAKDDHSYRPYMHPKSTETSYFHRNDLNGSPSEQSERVAELAIFDNNFNSVNTISASRKIPGYFTLATEDPILPIEAFFPQVKKN